MLAVPYHVFLLFVPRTVFKDRVQQLPVCKLPCILSAPTLDLLASLDLLKTSFHGPGPGGNWHRDAGDTSWHLHPRIGISI